jgi:hypothetical protein
MSKKRVRRAQRTYKGNQVRHFRARKPNSSIRTMPRPSAPIYADLNYCAVLVPERVFYSPFGSGAQQPDGKRHNEMVEAIRRSGMRYRVVTGQRRRVRTTRIYLGDESGLVLLKMIDGELIWKMFELTDQI